MKRQNIVLSIYLILVACACVNMGDAGKYGSRLLEPSFAKLEEGQGSYHGIVYDETSKTQVRDLSFFGHTNVGGILKESDDSVNRLELSKLKEIHVSKPSYDSRRYSDKDLVFATVTTVNGTKIKDLLFPKHVVICGKEKNTNMEKSWFVGKINKIIVEHEPAQKKMIPTPAVQKVVPAAPVQTKEEPKKEQGVIGAFIGIVDSIIDFVKAIFNFFWNMTKL